MEELIKQNVRFEGSSKGWHHVKCRLCNDYKIRASFSFQEDRIKYSCFNCGASEAYKKNSTFLSKEFREILLAFNISETDIDLELGKNFFNKDQIVLAKKKAETRVEEVELPPGSYRVEKAEDGDLWTQVAEEYLAERGLSLDSHKWYLSTDPAFRDRLIIPYFKDGKVIFWQARSFLDNVKKRYLAAAAPIEPILFGYEELEKNSNAPLYITEGVFDAISIGGVSMLGSKLYKHRIDAFTKSRRRKVFVIDRKDKENNGYKLGLEVLKHGWEITFVSGNDTKDVNHSVAKYGKLYTISDLMTNTKSGFEARVYLETMCKTFK